jgi:hypothetical protein
MPRGHAIGQTVFDHQTNRQSHHPVRVVALGQRQIVHVRVEVGVAFEAAMLGVRKMNVAGPPTGRVAQIVQRPLDTPEPIGPVAAARTGPLPVVATLPDDLRLGQVFNGRDTFAGIGGTYSPGFGMATGSCENNCPRNHRQANVNSQEKYL